MNGLSIMLAAIVILTIAVISGAVVLAMLGGLRRASQPPWAKRKGKGSTIAHHHG